MSERKHKINTSFGGSRYDLSTFLGRVQHFWAVTDPRALLWTDAEIRSSVDLLDRYQASKEGEWEQQYDEQDIYRAKAIRDSAVHPETHEIIPRVLRFSSQTPMNLLIGLGLLQPAASSGSILFWHIFNQSYNAGVNYANGNRSTDTAHSTLAQAFVAAVAVSCALALGLSRLAARTNSSALRLAAPFASVGSASLVNLAVIRASELTEGIDIYDPHDNLVGKSTAAGRYAIATCAVSRLFVAGTALIIPPAIMAAIQRQTGLLTRYPSSFIPLQLLLIGLTLVTALPAGVAFFPPSLSLPVSRLEEKFHQLRSPDGQPVSHIHFHRGL